MQLLILLWVLIIPTTSFAMSNTTNLGEGVYISSVASHKNIVVLAGMLKTEGGKKQAIVYVSDKFKKWKRVNAIFLKEAVRVNVVYSAFRGCFLLAVKQLNENQIIISKDARNWEPTQERSWASIMSIQLNNETTKLMWNGQEYDLYNTHHNVPVSIWSASSALSSIAPVNTAFRSFCLMQGRLIVSGFSNPAPVSYTKDLYRWSYPTSLLPKTKRGNIIYRLHCMKNNTLIGTGKSDGIFVYDPYTKGMVIYAKVDENKKIKFHHMEIDTPIITSTILGSELHMIIWDKEKKKLFYVSQDISKPLGSFTFHNLISKKVGAYPQMVITDKKRVIIAGSSFVFEYIL